jgi:hypothetical protein
VRREGPSKVGLILSSFDGRLKGIDESAYTKDEGEKR